MGLQVKVGYEQDHTAQGVDSEVEVGLRDESPADEPEEEHQFSSEKAGPKLRTEDAGRNPTVSKMRLGFLRC